ncbi:MAG: glycosyltransferase family 2 protein [Planctomycetota bacterium]|nr:glycosyltransferase family 2 protein [Planctomycetota bacterium]MDA1177825.1 glycosyltransferase family 2 protein [Planctomycetota bacterium]
MLSLVIPVFNEADSLVDLHREIDAVAQQNGYDVEILFVDDGSRDASWEIITRIAATDVRVGGIRFRRNFGKAAALSAGFQNAVGEIIITLDADLQDDPAEIPRFLQRLNQGADVVSGWKRARHDPWHKVGPSRVFNWMVSWLTGVHLHDHNCGFKSYRAEALQGLNLYGELHRFIPVLAAAQGWRIGEIEVHHRRRQFGVSKYGLLRIPKGFLDLMTVKLITGYGNRPQHLFGAFGMLCFVIGTVGVMGLTVAWLITRLPGWEHPLHLHERAIFYYSLAAMLLGGQFMSVGFLAELVTSLNWSKTRLYSVSERVGKNPEKTSSGN